MLRAHPPPLRSVQVASFRARLSRSSAAGGCRSGRTGWGTAPLPLPRASPPPLPAVLGPSLVWGLRVRRGGGGAGCTQHPRASAEFAPPGRSRTYVASPDSKSGGPCRQTNRGSSQLGPPGVPAHRRGWCEATSVSGPCGPARDAARAADARQVGEGDPRPGEVRRPVVRAQVGRLPLPGLQGRRRGRAGQPQHQAADPLLPRGGRRGPRAAARAVRARRRALRGLRDRRRRLEFETLQERIHPAEPDRHAGRETPGRLRRLRPARARRRVVRRPPVRRAARRPRGGAGRPRRDPCTSPAPRPTPPRPSSGSTSSRAPGSTAWSPSRWGRRTSPTPAPCSRSSTSAPPTSSSPATASTRPPRRSEPLLGSLLLGLYDRRRAAAHRRLGQLHREAPRRADRGAAAAGRATSRTTRGASGGVPDRQPRPGARHPEPVERGQGPVVHAAAARAGARGGVRPHGGPPVPAHRPLQAVAHRPRPRVVRLRPAGGAGELRPHA